jgi:hypothetical protein
VLVLIPDEAALSWRPLFLGVNGRPVLRPRGRLDGGLFHSGWPPDFSKVIQVTAADGHPA